MSSCDVSNHHLSLRVQDLVVEFYDMRAAHQAVVFGLSLCADFLVSLGEVFLQFQCDS